MTARVLVERGALILGATLLAGGCAARDGAVEGVVFASPLTCDVRGNVLAEDAPLAGADVRLRCGEVETLLSTSRADGRVRWAGDRRLPTDCEIVITKEGYRAKAIRIDDVCVDRSRGDCELLAVNADLERI